MEIIEIKSWCDIPENYTGMGKYGFVNIEHYLNVNLHREDGPPINCDNGTVMYFLNRKLHREDGPAIIRKNGTIEYYINGNNIITKEVNNWIIENNIPEVWNNTHKILFKLTFG